MPIAGVRWPTKWPSSRKLDVTMGYIDVFPTIVSSVGLDPEIGQLPERALDGVDLNDVLTGRREALPARDWYSYHGQAGEHKETISVTNESWKLVVMGPNVQKNEVGQEHDVFSVCHRP